MAFHFLPFVCGLWFFLKVDDLKKPIESKENKPGSLDMKKVIALSEYLKLQDNR